MEFNKIKLIASTLNIGSEDFWNFIKEKIHSYPKLANEFPWGCFPITDQNNILIDIKVIVPVVVDEATLVVNIHELAHAYELYGLLGKECIYRVENSENFAKEKETLYLKLVRDKKLTPLL